MLWVSLDASATLGPITLDLLGLGIGVPISNFKLNKLSSLTGDELGALLKSIQWRLRGMGVAFEKPPLILAGVFEHEIALLPDGSEKDAFRGGIAITFPPYMFVAVGEYSVITKGSKNYKSIFIYAKLDGPVITLAFATISGVRLGFGYNSIVRQPTGPELDQFPFLSDQGVDGAGNNPMNILRSMTQPQNGSVPWVSSQQDSYWFALGMTISACEILFITAVAMLNFRDNGIVVNLFADAVATLPAKLPKDSSQLALLYVEMAMVAELNFVEGFLRVEAALAPTSFIYVPMCRLHGG